MSHSNFMQEALQEAKKAFAKGEVPIGAVIVHEGEIIGRGHNLREATQQTASHAEMIAIEEACKAIGSWRLEECSLYVTIEPCPMCAGAIIQARMKSVYYGAKDSKSGVHTSVVSLFDGVFNHKVEIEGGILENESKEIMKSFFIALRKEKNSV